jgi:hypothetical protein
MTGQGRDFAAEFQWLAWTCWLTALDTTDRALVATSRVSFFGIDARAISRGIFHFRIFREYLAKNQCIATLTFVPDWSIRLPLIAGDQCQEV